MCEGMQIGVIDPAKRFQRLREAVSTQILTGYSDHCIADAVGTSIEFVRRQRKFLAPRPPILPAQLKRGIFCKEFMKNMNTVQRKSPQRDKLIAWIEANPDGYREGTFAQIAERSGVSQPTVQRFLIEMIAERDGITHGEVMQHRKEAGFFKGSKRTSEVSSVRTKLKAWVEKDPDAHLELGLAAIAEQAGVSISTVKRYLADCVAACKGISADEVWEQRKAAGFVRGGNRRNGNGKPDSDRSVQQPTESGRKGKQPTGSLPYSPIASETQPVKVGSPVKDPVVDQMSKKPLPSDIFAFLDTIEAGITEKDLEIWYLASPYADPNPAVVEARVEAVSKLTAKLINENPNTVVFSPIAYTHHLQGEPYRAEPGAGWYLWDLAMLRWCKKLVVARISGWMESEGVRLEIAYAMGAGIPVEFLDGA